MEFISYLYKQLFSNKKNFIIVFFILQTLHAGTTGKISGKVLDKNNEPLIGCNIIIRGTSLGAATNLEGEYFIINVPPGSYDISASMIGYGTVTIEGTQVMVDLTAKTNLLSLLKNPLLDSIKHLCLQ